MASINTENPEEPFPTTKKELKRTLAQKIEERKRICATLDQEIKTIKQYLGQTVNPVDGGEEESEQDMQREYLKRRDGPQRAAEQRVAEGRARTAAWVDARNVPLDSLDFGVSQRAAVPAGMARTATWVDDYNRRSRAAAELSLQKSTGHRFDGGRRTRRKSQRRKKLSKRRKKTRKRRKRKTKRRR